MRRNRIVNYHENRILAASPSALARIALDEAIKSTRAAIDQTRAQDHQGRGQSLSRAMNLLTEFTVILNEGANPDLVKNLKDLAGYCHNQLLQAHVQQSEALMKRVIELLQPIVEAWTTVERREGQLAATERRVN